VMLANTNCGIFLDLAAYIPFGRLQR